MTSQTGKEIVTMLILLNISWSKDNQKYFPLKNHAENKAGRLALDYFLFFKKCLYDVNANG